MSIITDSRIRWKCRRGLLELDIFLEKYCQQQLSKLTQAEKQVFFEFLDTPDQILSDWLFTDAKPTDERYQQIIAAIRQLR